MITSGVANPSLAGDVKISRVTIIHAVASIKINRNEEDQHDRNQPDARPCPPVSGRVPVPLLAFSTRLMMRAKVVSAPTSRSRCVRQRRITRWSPQRHRTVALSFGMLSPVIDASLTEALRRRRCRRPTFAGPHQDNVACAVSRSGQCVRRARLAQAQPAARSRSGLDRGSRAIHIRSAMNSRRSE